MNGDIRTTARKAGVKQWQIAQYLGISEGTLCRWMRGRLSDETREAIFRAIETIGAEVKKHDA